MKAFIIVLFLIFIIKSPAQTITPKTGINNINIKNTSPDLKQITSQKELFNRALYLYQQDKLQSKSKAYFRQILFQNPYNIQTKQVLQKLGDKKYFWLWIPPDFILILLFCSYSIFMVLIFFKKQLWVYGYLPFLFISSFFGIYYFYQRNLDHYSLIQDTVVLSAPHLKAPILFKQKAGVVLKVLSKNYKVTHWSHVEISNTQSGWLSSKILIPVKMKYPLKVFK